MQGVWEAAAKKLALHGGACHTVEPPVAGHDRSRQVTLHSRHACLQFAVRRTDISRLAA
jgi:hypothetical protein